MFTYDAGEGVTMRLLEQRDAPMLQQAIVDNLAHLSVWRRSVQGYSDPKMAEDWVRANLERHARGDGHDAGVFVGGEFAGLCGVNFIDRVDLCASFSYSLCAKFCGRGIITRCVAHQCDYYFGAEGLHRLEVHCAAGNVPSRRIPERVGFTLEASHRERIRLNGVWHDEIVYAMLAADWRAKGGGEGVLATLTPRR